MHSLQHAVNMGSFAAEHSELSSCRQTWQMVLMVHHNIGIAAVNEPTIYQLRTDSHFARWWPLPITCIVVRIQGT